MTAPEIRKLAEDYLALPPGPYQAESYEGEKFYVVGRTFAIYPLAFDDDTRAEAEARRLNAMPGLLRAASWNGKIRRNEYLELRALIDRVEAHAKGDIHG